MYFIDNIVTDNKYQKKILSKPKLLERCQNILSLKHLQI